LDLANTYDYDLLILDLTTSGTSGSEILAESDVHVRLQEMEAYLKVTTPFDGIIAERGVHPGTLAGPSASEPQDGDRVVKRAIDEMREGVGSKLRRKNTLHRSEISRVNNCHPDVVVGMIPL